MSISATAFKDDFDLEDTELEAQVARMRARNQRFRLETPLDQIPRIGGYDDVTTESAHAYYVRLDGATIPDALTLYPNGGTPSFDHIADRKKRARAQENAGRNALYYRARQRKKGLVYIGERLTREGIEFLVKVIMLNRPYEIERVTEEIEGCERTLKNSESSKDREYARRRKEQLQHRLAMLRQEIDPKAMADEIDRAAEAIALSAMSPQMRAAVEHMIVQKYKGTEFKLEELAQLVETARRGSGHSNAKGAGSTAAARALGET